MMIDKTNHVVDVWFSLIDDWTAQGVAPTHKPPTLRDACYNYAVATALPDKGPSRDTDITEAYVSGLERGAVSALRQAWLAHREGSGLWQSRRGV